MVVPGSKPSTPQQIKQAQVEGLICAQADLAIWFTEQALASARKRHPGLGGRGKAMVPGVDPPPFTFEPYQLGEKFVLGHFGSLSETRNLVSTIAALDLLLDQQPALSGRVELHVYGGPLDRLSAAAAAQARHPCVKHFGRIEADMATGKSGREQILQRMRGVDVLLLLHGSEPICAEYIPSKMYEYFWTGRPIIATVHANNQMKDILRGMGHAVVLTGDANNVARELRDQLTSLIGYWRSKKLPTHADISPYTAAAAVAQQLCTLRKSLS
jgi:glycosyltransferase involved in cell wall biosynthesis